MGRYDRQQKSGRRTFNANRRHKERTCVGCRRTQEAQELLRFVVYDQYGLRFDPAHKAPGRGVYVCPSAACLREAVRNKGFHRSLRRRLPQLTFRDLRDQIAEVTQARVLRLLSNGRRAGKTVAGSSAVTRALGDGDLQLLFMARDVSRGTRERFTRSANRHNVPVITSFDGLTLGTQCGLEFAGVVGIRESTLGERILEAWRLLEEMLEHQQTVGLPKPEKLGEGVSQLGTQTESIAAEPSDEAATNSPGQDPTEMRCRDLSTDQTVGPLAIDAKQEVDNTAAPCEKPE